MGFKLFKREKKKEVRLKELREVLEREIEAHQREVEKFAEENYSKLKNAVDSLLSEVDSLRFDTLPQRLRGVAKNFVSMMRKQWKVDEGNEGSLFFEEVSGKAAKLAISMQKGFRILFALKLPEFEGINQRIKEVTSILSAYEEKKNDPSVRKKLELLHKIEGLEELEELISKAKNKLERLEKTDEGAEREEEGDREELAEYLEEERKIKDRLSALEGELQKKLGMVRKPLRLYAHMVGERLEVSTYRDLENGTLRKMAEKAKSEIVKGALEIKETQREGIIKSLEFISRGETRKVIEEIDLLKKELSTLQAKIKTIESKKRSRIAGEKQRIKKEISSLRKKLDSFTEKKKELMGEIRRIAESLSYELVDS